MKRKTAKELLADSFRELAQTKSVDKITVKDITENCGYSTATFYRHYKDKYDLIAWDYSQNVGGIVNKYLELYKGAPFDWRDSFVDGARYFEREKKYLANLFQHTSGLESFRKYMTETNYKFLLKLINYNTERVESLDEKMHMYIRFYCHALTNVTCDWVVGHYKLSAEELAEVFDVSLPQPLRDLLT